MPSVTCPSPAITTLLSRRTQITVVERIFSRIVCGNSYFNRTTGLPACRAYRNVTSACLAHHRMPRECVACFGIVGAEMRAAALLARQRAARNQQRYLPHTALLGRLRRQCLQLLHTPPGQSFRRAHDAALLPCDPLDFARQRGASRIHRPPFRIGASVASARLAHRPAGADAEYHAFQQRIAGQPIRPVDARARRFTRRKQARHVRAAVQIRTHAAHRIVRRRSHRRRRRSRYSRHRANTSRRSAGSARG